MVRPGAWKTLLAVVAALAVTLAWCHRAREDEWADRFDRALGLLLADRPGAAVQTLQKIARDLGSPAELEANLELAEVVQAAARALKAGDAKRALELLEGASEHAMVHLYRSRALAATGRRDEARREMRRARELAPEAPWSGRERR